MTSFSWFSGNRESSRKCLEIFQSVGVGDQRMKSCGEGGTKAGAVDQPRFVMYKLWRPRPRRAVPDRTDVAAFSDVHAGPTRGSGLGARDSGALHLSDAGPVVLDGVVLGAAVVPDGEA